MVTTSARVTAAEVRQRLVISTLLWAAQILLAAFSCSMLPRPS
jgi:hypothetical protein